VGGSVAGLPLRMGHCPVADGSRCHEAHCDTSHDALQWLGAPRILAGRNTKGGTGTAIPPNFVTFRSPGLLPPRHPRRAILATPRPALPANKWGT